MESNRRNSCKLIFSIKKYQEEDDFLKPYQKPEIKQLLKKQPFINKVRLMLKSL